MKVLFINDNYFLTGGSNISNRNLVEFLCSKNILVSVITSSNDGFTSNPIHVYTIPYLIRKYPAQLVFPNMIRIKQIIANEDPDLIHLQVPTPISLIALWLAKRKRIPIVIGIHELPVNIAVYSPIARGVIETLSRKILAYGLEKANVAIAPTEFAKSYYKKLVPKSDIRVISNGINLKDFRYNPSAAAIFRDKYLSHLDPTIPIIIFVGRIMPDKDLNTLVRAAQGLNVLVILVGYMWESYNKELNLLSEGKIITTGWISRGLLHGAYSAADFFVQPSTSELQSLAVLEAMSVGLPIIAANHGPLPELVVHGVNGLLFEPHNHLDLRKKILFLLNNRHIMLRMRSGSLNLVKKHSLSITGEELLKVYEDLIKE